MMMSLSSVMMQFHVKVGVSRQSHTLQEQVLLRSPSGLGVELQRGCVDPTHFIT